MFSYRVEVETHEAVLDCQDLHQRMLKMTEAVDTDSKKLGIMIVFRGRLSEPNKELNLQNSFSLMQRILTSFISVE